MLLKQVKIMEDHGPWKFTEEQIIKIKQFDSESINKFYFDNLELVKSMAFKFMRQHPKTANFSFEDCVQQFYVDIPFYNYSTRHYLYKNIIYGSFLHSSCGGILNRKKLFVCLSLDCDYEVLDDVLQLKDIIPDEKVNLLDDTYLCKEDRERNDNLIIEFLEKVVKNKKQINYMYCYLFTDLKEKDVNGNEYSEFLHFAKKNM